MQLTALLGLNGLDRQHRCWAYKLLGTLNEQNLAARKENRGQGQGTEENSPSDGLVGFSFACVFLLSLLMLLEDEAASSSSSSSTTTSSNAQRDLSEWQERQLVMFFPKTRYELHAIRLAKLKGMAIENEESSNTIGFEVEMAETKPPTS
ncbi:hypothetical protein DKX38_003534 [Salix brachista]|uniref:Uncharacterized protein n=1 Tax=Salix brachista TaxID=2182728 RepID=A0A5N5NSQ2_9ROSI|nr:hypothetical protein DKX38_003534 [Salix brachista]